MPWMQMEMMGCCVKPATLWIPISRQTLCREHCWQLSEDSQCSLSEEKALIRTPNCFADPKCSGRDNVGTRGISGTLTFWVGAVWGKQAELPSDVTLPKCQVCPTPRSIPNPSKMSCLSLPSLYFYFWMPHLTQPGLFKGTNSTRCYKGRICAAPLLFISNSSVILKSIMGNLQV